ncbi:T9SS type A sorting domain-containing protein [Polaribacter sp. BAL334]|uniref:T9SS type A sorting domain-containing protein n=1 Tax=Polaribacter sp. BAL334 TaxID=1708178 RepID=UPI0018D26A46|nr:T9SS type A sorting domain-containing protein [Polaribacter sp. BAL334]MBG7613110.1 T9SS type A sorting domain-containing protein [Polaribacter sp. BAL334]
MIIPKHNLLFFIVIFCTHSLFSQLDAVPIRYFGAWDRGDAINDYSDPKYDYILGTELSAQWNEIQPNAPGEFDFSMFQDGIDKALQFNKMIKISIGVGPAAPSWIYDNGVPLVEIDVFDPIRHAGFVNNPYYLNEQYIAYYYELIKQFSLFLRNQPQEKFDRIGFVQVKTGTTGDEEPYKGIPRIPAYEIDNNDWIEFRQNAFIEFKKHFNDVPDRKIILNFNSIDVDKQELLNTWVFTQIDPNVGFSIKGGPYNRGHHLEGEPDYKAQWYKYLVDPKEISLFSASEMDQSWQKPVFAINTELGFYWSILGGLNTGVSSTNVTKSAIDYIYDHDEIRVIYKMYNKFAQQVYPKKASAVLSIFHEGLDASDTAKFPEETYGQAARGNIARYKAIAEAYLEKGAKVDDTLALNNGQVYQRLHQTGYNDVGWNIQSGNYERFLYQINPEETSIGLFRVRGTINTNSSKYDRFARSFEHSVDRKKDTMYFKFHDDVFIETLPKKLTFKVTWLDSIAGSTWALQYKDITGLQKQLQKTSIGDWQWKSEEFVIEDLMTGGVGTNGADFMLVNTDDLNDIFHGIEIDIERQAVAANPQIKSALDGDWHLPATWIGNLVPTTTDDIIIDHAVRIDRNYSFAAKNVTISATGNLTIQPRTLLTVDGNLVNNNSITFNASGNNQEMGAIKILGAGTFTGNDVTANIRPMALSTVADNWFLISSPLKGASITDFIANSQVIRKNAALQNSIGFYNDANAPGSKYTYYTDADALAAGDFIEGKGYSALIDLPVPATNHRFRFTGQINTDNVSIPISDAGNGFNLVGNPYTAFLYANTDGNATNNILTANSSVLEENTLWFYDAEFSSFVTKNLGDTGFDIAPAQGFFVRAKIGGGTSQNFNFTEAMQSDKFNDGIFYKSASNNRFEFDLTITNGEKSSKTSVRYIDGTTTNFDNGFDSSIFGAFSAIDLKIATQLVTNNTGKNLAIQSLPTTNYEGTVIPLNITSVANKEFTIKANVKNLPENIYVYLEDRVAKTVTRLDQANASFKMIPSVNLSGSGRFYIHTTASSVLNIDSETLTNVSIFKTSNNTLKIIGLQNGDTSVKIFNILGKQVLATSFNSLDTNEIKIPNLSKGVYFIQLTNNAGKLNKKIILE